MSLPSSIACCPAPTSKISATDPLPPFKTPLADALVGSEVEIATYGHILVFSKATDIAARLSCVALLEWEAKMERYNAASKAARCMTYLGSALMAFVRGLGPTLASIRSHGSRGLDIR